jgi:hypothetical protein
MVVDEPPIAAFMRCMAGIGLLGERANAETHSFSTV